MEKGKYLSAILRSPQTVFSFNDIMMLWGKIRTDAAKMRIYYYVKRGELYPIRRGIYSKDKNYDRMELATKILTPSYISFETVLAEAGIVFQYYDQIFAASYITRDIIADKKKYSYKRMKDSILFNSAGVENREYYSIASAERAFLDVLYLYKNYHFDNLSPIHWSKVQEILPIYGNDQDFLTAVGRYRRRWKKK